jgi:LPXTG-site transpeptidase (sortase) family protein
MEAGYDYLLLRSQFEQRFFRASGILLAIAGAVLLSAGIAYFTYAHIARSDLAQMNVSVASTIPQYGSENVLVVPDPAVSSPPAAMGGGPEITLPILPMEQDIVGRPRVPEPIPTERSVSLDRPETVTVVQAEDVILPRVPPPAAIETQPIVSSSAIAAQRLFPEDAIKATYWSNPMEYEPPSYVEASLIQGFEPIGPNELALPGSLPGPTKIIIPAIGIDSEVIGLKIMQLGDSRAYETPKHVVGHIPETSNPGEKGSSWYFGHLESPIAGEGNVFYNLPKIPDILRKGQDVYVVVENGEASYLYRITETRVVHKNDMQLYDTDGPTIHLVTCVPRFVYDHRLVATGELVGVRQ